PPRSPTSGRRGYSTRTLRSRSGCAGSASSIPPGAIAFTAKLPPDLQKKEPQNAALFENNRRLPTLPGGCPPSTIGPGRLNFSVRNGKRCFPAGKTAEIVKAARAFACPAHLQNSIATSHVFKIKTSGN